MARRYLYHPTHMGEHLTDKLLGLFGSWASIGVQFLLLGIWIILNAVPGFSHWDGYPFALCTLVLSVQAVFLVLLLLLAYNRQTERERRRDDAVAEEVQSLYSTLEMVLRINRQQLELLKILEER